MIRGGRVIIGWGILFLWALALATAAAASSARFELTQAFLIGVASLLLIIFAAVSIGYAIKLIVGD